MIKAQGLQLYTQSRNSAGERVRIALHLKGLQYEYIPVSTMTSEECRSVNPQGLMPALRVENSVFAQSTAILECLEEAYPHPPLLPADLLIDVSLTVSPVKDANGKIVGASKTARDITEQKRNQEQISVLAREAEHRSKNILSNVQAIVNLSQSDTCFGL
jgi:glutathione S-transferase